MGTCLSKIRGEIPWILLLKGSLMLTTLSCCCWCPQLSSQSLAAPGIPWEGAGTPSQCSWPARGCLQGSSLVTLAHSTAPEKLLFTKHSITFVRNLFFSQGHLSFQSPRELGINCSSPSAADPSACLKCGRLQNKKHHLLNEAKHHNRFNDVDLSPNSCFEITTNH